MPSPGSYLVHCWNCLGEFDAAAAIWCSDDPKSPTKLCPFCLRCFCDASERYKQEFWRGAPHQLLDELQTLTGSKDRIGDILIRMKKLRTPDLLDGLVEQKATGKRLGEILVSRGLVAQDDIAAALKTQGVSPLADAQGTAYASSPVWENSEPAAIIEYILTLAATKGASDIQIEPQSNELSVRYRIDGFSFRVDPIPKRFQAAVTHKLFETFGLDRANASRPQSARVVRRLAKTDYDLVVQTLPTAQGVGAALKLVNRETFIKDFATLGLELEDQVRLTEELKGGFGLVLVSSPVYGGNITTSYAIMSFLAQSGRDVLSLESPIHWTLEGARQVEVETGPGGPRMEETLRSMLAVRPDAIFLSHLPDRTTAHMAAQLASSLLVLPTITAQSAAGAVANFVELGVPPQLLATCLSAVTCQRLVRVICRTCRQEAQAPAPQTLVHHGVSPEEASFLRFFKGRGCPACNTVGYRGRKAVFEVLPGSVEVRAALKSGLLTADLEAVAVGAGMRTIRGRCLELVQGGVTTFDEFVRLSV